MKTSHPDDIDPTIKEKVNQKILNFISYKLRSEKEVSDRLSQYLQRYKKIKKSQKDEIKAELMERLEEINLINDVYFAENFVTQKVNSPKPASRMQIKQFLIKKGVPGKVITKAIKLYTDDEEDQKITKDAKKKLVTLKKLTKLQKKKRLYNYLAGKGYPFVKVRCVVDRIIEVA